MDRNLVIGCAAAFVVIGAVAAVAAGVDWDPRDVAAADHYREQERERAERYRAEVAGQPAPRASADASRSDSDMAASRRAEREVRRAERRATHQDWWERTVEGVTGRIDGEAVEGWRGHLEDLGDWWRHEVGPAWEDWATRQEERVAEPERFGPSSRSPEMTLPPAVEQILEDSLRAPPEGEPREPRRSGDAKDWWAEERERMRDRRPGR